MPYFDTYGPYKINLQGRECTAKQTDFWNEIAVNWPDLHAAIGCYLFCMQFGDRFRPWYVGVTVAEKGFKGEAFQKHKLDIYNDIIPHQRGTPVMFFFPLMTEQTGRYSKNRKGGKTAISWLEKILMGFAYRRNPELSNVKDMKHLRNVEVLGLIGKRRGRPFREAVAVRKALIGPSPMR